jgi:thiol-disulfide isomerase/thioredoxin
MCASPESSDRATLIHVRALLIAAAIIARIAVSAQSASAESTADEQRIAGRLKLRQLPDDKRSVVTRELALEISRLPAGPRKLQFASDLANLATEGDFGRDTLQEVTTTLEIAIREHGSKEPSQPHVQLVQLVRYENMRANLNEPVFELVLKQLEADDAARQSADFTLTDLSGKQWSLSQLRGSVVLVNFWATWCPPCRKEMPDLEALHKEFGSKGLVVLAITDEDAQKVKPFLTANPNTLTILLDPGRKTNEAFRIQGIPKSFVFDRKGKLVAQSIDMRTRGQFMQMLAKAGLK